MTEENKNVTQNEEIVVEPEEMEDVSEEVTDQQETNQESEVVGGVILLRTKEDGIIMQPYENLGIVDITVFAEYLKQLVNVEWKTRIESGQLED